MSETAILVGKDQFLRLQSLLDDIHGATDVSTLPNFVVSALVESFAPDVACFYAHDKQRKTFRRVASHPEEFWRSKQVRKAFDQRPTHGWGLGRVMQLKKMVLIRDAVEEAKANKYAPFSSDIGTEALVPIVAQEAIVGRESVIGVIILSWNRSRVISESAFALLGLVATSISSAYSNALSRDRREKHITFLRTVINVEGSDRDTLYQQFLIALSKILPTKFLSLWLYDVNNQVMLARSFYPTKLSGKDISFDSFDRTILSCADSASGKVIETRRPHVFAVNDTDRFSNRNFANRHGLEWFVSFPIVSEDSKVLGVINLWPDGDVQDFDQDAQSDYQQYVSHMASACRMATLLFEESLLFAYDAFFRSLLRFSDDSASWNSLAISISRQMYCEGCSIFLVEKDGALHLKGTTGLINSPKSETAVYAPGEGLTGFAFCQSTPVLYHREFADRYKGIHISKFREHVGKSKSILLSQISDANSKVIGVIRCTNKLEVPSKRLGRFTQEDVSELEKVCGVISSIYGKVIFVREQEMLQEHSFRSLHHEIISPVDGIMAHIEWIERHIEKVRSKWRVNRIKLKFADLRQIAKVLENAVFLMGPFHESIQPKRLNVSIYEIVQTCLGFVFHEAKQGDIRINSAQLPGIIYADGPQMMRVFYNLIRNALKYADTSEPKRYINIRTSLATSTVIEITVEDNGIGVPTGEDQLIFERFRRGSNAKTVAPIGEGLGLYYCRKIIERHGGVIRVRSLRKPTEFVVTLEAVSGR
jgi:signal transduction histidine kinase